MHIWVSKGAHPVAILGEREPGTGISVQPVVLMFYTWVGWGLRCTSAAGASLPAHRYSG